MTARGTPGKAPKSYGYRSFDKNYTQNGVIDATRRADPSQRDVQKIVHNPQGLLMERIQQKISK